MVAKITRVARDDLQECEAGLPGEDQCRKLPKCYIPPCDGREPEPGPVDPSLTRKPHDHPVRQLL